MARITARQAHTRSRTRRETSRAQARKTREDARRKFLRQVARLNQNMSAQVIDSHDDDNDDEPQHNNQDHENDIAIGPAKIPLHKGTKRKGPRRIDRNNRKITEYFHVSSRSRENIPKSPQPPRIFATRPQSQGRLGRPISEPMISRNSSDIEVIEILSDSDCPSECEDEDEEQEDSYCHEADHNQQVNDQNGNLVDGSMAQDSSYESLTYESPLKKEMVDCKPTIVAMPNGLFQGLNSSIKVDDELEIVDILPPISLRDHPVFDLEEES